METSQRQKIITQTSMINIAANLIVAALKVLIGLAAGSLAIISEGINNAMDVVSSVIMLIGSKLSGKHPDEKHPFGYGRMEYLATLVLAMLILYTGIELARDSFDGIIHPSKMTISILAIGIVVGSAIVKFVLGLYTMKKGDEAKANALVALGKDCRDDAFLSVITIVSSLIYMFTNFSIDAWAGLFFSLVILKNGYETMKDTVAEILGRPGEEELARNLYKEIRQTDGVLSAVDLMLHNYGPERYSGSVNIEIDHKKTLGEIYEIIHDLQLRIMNEYKVTMVFGMYAVDKDHPEMKEMRKYIGDFVRSMDHVLSFHALYLSKSTDKIYVDFIVDYDLRDWDAIQEKFEAYMAEKYENDVVLTIETQFV